MTSSAGLRANTEDLLWVPVLTHYAPVAGTPVDAARMLAHLRNIHGEVRQIMLAGSTGDGWEMDDARFDKLIDFAASPEVQALDLSLLFGVLRADTAAVIARLQHLEARLSNMPDLAARVRGVAICPPVDPGASQEKILAHYAAVLEASRLPVAVYQLPQVTGCRIEPTTLARLADNPRVIMFKDSSGEDTVAKSGKDFAGVVLVRGAEGGYLEALMPNGAYHGWLLSTGNALGAPLRRLLEFRAAGEVSAAAELSRALTTFIEGAFAAAANEEGANAFSNANRAMDHLRAFGSAWRDAALPVKVNGERLSTTLVERIETLGKDLLNPSGSGYLR